MLLIISPSLSSCEKWDHSKPISPLYSLLIVRNPLHHPVNGIHQAIHIDAVLYLLDCAIGVEEMDPKQVISFVINDRHKPFVDITLYTEPQSVVNRLGAIETPTQHDRKKVLEDFDNVFCHFHSDWF